jgi:hypothetical protein
MNEATKEQLQGQGVLAFMLRLCEELDSLGDAGLEQLLPPLQVESGKARGQTASRPAMR